MEKIRIDGVEYEVPAQVANHLRGQKARLDAAEASLKDAAKAQASAEAKADTAQAKADAAAAELAKEKKARADAADTAKAELKARVALEAKAGEVLGDGAKLDSMSDTEIKLAVLKRLDEAFNGEGKSAAYVDARFDLAMEAHEANDGQLADVRRAGAGESGKKPARLDDDSARVEFMKKSAAGYQGRLAASTEE